MGQDQVVLILQLNSKIISIKMIAVKFKSAASMGVFAVKVVQNKHKIKQKQWPKKMPKRNHPRPMGPRTSHQFRAGYLHLRAGCLATSSLLPALHPVFPPICQRGYRWEHHWEHHQGYSEEPPQRLPL